MNKGKMIKFGKRILIISGIHNIPEFSKVPFSMYFCNEFGFLDFIYLFGVLRHFQHSTTGHITTGS